jgi:hypothetical protein
MTQRYCHIPFVDRIAQIALTPEGGVIVGGDSIDRGPGNIVIVNPGGFTTVKYLPNSLATKLARLRAPKAYSTHVLRLPVRFTLPESAANGTVKLTFTGPTTTVLTLTDNNNSAGTHALVLNPLNLAASPNVADVSGPDTLNSGFDITLSYQDARGNAAATSTPIRGVGIFSQPMTP